MNKTSSMLAAHVSRFLKERRYFCLGLLCFSCAFAQIVASLSEHLELKRVRPSGQIAVSSALSLSTEPSKTADLEKATGSAKASEPVKNIRDSESSLLKTADALKSIDSSKTTSTSEVAKPLKKSAVKPPVVMTEKAVAKLLRKAGIQEEHVHRLTCTARFESGFNPKAFHRNKNGSQDSGLFQINDIWKKECKMSRADLLIPINNARCAKKVLVAQGLDAWMAFGERKEICEKYRVGDFEKKGHKTIRSIVEGHEEQKEGKKGAS